MELKALDKGFLDFIFLSNFPTLMTWCIYYIIFICFNNFISSNLLLRRSFSQFTATLIWIISLSSALGVTKCYMTYPEYINHLSLPAPSCHKYWMGRRHMPIDLASCSVRFSLQQQDTAAVRAGDRHSRKMCELLI